jgi:esterase/lipase
MYLFSKKKSIVLFCILFLFSFIYFVGFVLDLEAERVVHQLYARDVKGIIIGNQSIEKKDLNQKNALVLFHGFLDSPHVYHEVIEQLEKSKQFDIYAPLLPYHARNLESAARLKNTDIADEIERKILQLSKHYSCVTVVGHSYSANILIQLAYEKKLPQNINLVLYAPALYIQNNTPINHIRNHIYGLWRNYCNYELLGCEVSPNSGDKYSQLKLYSEKNLKYRVVTAVHELFELDNQQRNHLKQLDLNFSVIIAKNDNRVTYYKIANECKLNQKHCQLIAFEDGKHSLHYGKHQRDFVQLIEKIATKNQYHQTQSRISSK